MGTAHVIKTTYIYKNLNLMAFDCPKFIKLDNPSANMASGKNETE